MLSLGGDGLVRVQLLREVQNFATPLRPPRGWGDPPQMAAQGEPEAEAAVDAAVDAWLRDLVALLARELDGAEEVAPPGGGRGIPSAPAAGAGVAEGAAAPGQEAAQGAGSRRGSGTSGRAAGGQHGQQPGAQGRGGSRPEPGPGPVQVRGCTPRRSGGIRPTASPSLAVPRPSPPGDAVGADGSRPLGGTQARASAGPLPTGKGLAKRAGKKVVRAQRAAAALAEGAAASHGITGLPRRGSVMTRAWAGGLRADDTGAPALPASCCLPGRPRRRDARG